ncbi:Coenzyme F420 hydrogenase/dehydrogenase, beta subunit C-terminal domain [Olsenella sp. Marseille-QA0557]|uniref:Coenzyme F420 hydrogenase/dehydrogenase, beta subunit C-terminal domain n=1 Tax=Olsenella sp. Marseille-QA0557 TaxID=3378782 RepID=UPI003D1250D5
MMRASGTRIELAAPEQCMGCGACYASCGFGAISMVPDAKGFYRPDVNAERCRDCGACAFACPAVGAATQKTEPLATLAAWDKDADDRAKATSGGAFMLVADAVLARGGWVCGAVMGQDMVVRHVVTRDREVVDDMRGSKYVQSDVSEAIAECLAHLQGGEEVLFTGVSCQVDAMRRVAGSRYADSLLLVDVLCHGAPSPRFWRAYLDYREWEEGDEIIGARFRKKEPSWTVFSLELTFKTEHRLRAWCTVEDLYLRAFLGDYITQEVCHECPYVGTGRVSDITLADFWGYVSETRRNRNTEEGISLVLANTPKGKSVVELLTGLHTIKKSLSEAVKGNGPLRSAFPANPKEEEFWSAFDVGGIEAVKGYLVPVRFSWKHRLSLFFNDHAYLLPVALRELLIDMRANE